MTACKDVNLQSFPSECEENQLEGRKDVDANSQIQGKEGKHYLEIEKKSLFSGPSFSLVGNIE